MNKTSITTGSWVRLALVVILAYLLFKVAGFLLVIIASIIIASAVEPATLWFSRRSIPRIAAVVAVYVSTAAVLSVVFYFLLLPRIQEGSGFLKTLTIYSNAVANDTILSGVFKTQNVFGGLDTPILMKELSEKLNSLSSFLSQGVLSAASMIFGGMSSFMLILVLSFYLAVQEDGVGKFLRIIVPTEYEEYALRLWKRSQLKIGYWMQGQLLLGIMVALMVYFALFIMGVPHALLLAVLAGIFELIPLFGPVLAAIPAVFIAYGALGTTVALIVAAIYLLIQQLENHILYPLVVKKVVGVQPMVSIVALIIGGQLAGFLGVLISVPIAVVAMEFISDYEERKIAKLTKNV